ncbi:cytochrome b5 [Nannochloropsis oceanica]
MRIISRERFGGAAFDTDPATMAKRLHKHGEAAAQGHCPPSQHAAAPCGVGVLEGSWGNTEYQDRQWDLENNISSAARCDCGQHTFCMLPHQQDGSMDTAPNTPDFNSSTSMTSHSQHSREKRGRVASGETPTNSSRRHLVLLPETGLSSSSLASVAAAEGGDPADIENLSASMVQAMTRKGGSTDGAVSGSNSNNIASSGVPSIPASFSRASFGLSSSLEQPQDHHLPGSNHPHPHPQQQPYLPQQQRRRGSVSGADGSSRSIDRGSSLVDGGAEESEALSLDRILVERNGDMVVVESSVVCDACPSCDDVCTLQDCRGCQEKRERLLARGLMVVVEAWGRTTRKESMQKQQQSSTEGGVCMPIIAKPRSTTTNDNSSHNDTSSSQHVYYSLCEIRRHRTLASCWLVAKGQVYDVTPYLSSHPAGAIAIARKAGGQDCSEDFEFHSGKAQKMWKKLRIGSVKACAAEGRCGGRGRGSGGGREDGSLVGSSCSIM